MKNALTKSRLVKFGPDLFVMAQGFESPFDEIDALKEAIAEHSGRCDTVVFDLLPVVGASGTRLNQAPLTNEGFDLVAVESISKKSDRHSQLEAACNFAYAVHFPEALDAGIVTKPARYKIKNPAKTIDESAVKDIITEEVALSFLR